MTTQPPPIVPHHDGPLEDHSPNDMPAARSILVIIVALLAVFAIVASIIQYNADEDAPAQPPVEQPAILDGRG